MRNVVLSLDYVTADLLYTQYDAHFASRHLSEYTALIIPVFKRQLCSQTNVALT